MSSVRDLGGGNYAVQVVNPDGSTLSGSGGAALTATAVGAVTADQNAVVAAATGLRFCGFSVRENAGSPAAAEFIIKHSATAAGGTALYPVTLAGDQSTADVIYDGIAAANGISIDWISGSVDLVIYSRVVA